jgi:hypothetical protein
MKKFIALIFLLNTANAADANYLAHIKNFENAARMVEVAGTCKRIGFEISQEDFMNNIKDELIAPAILDGMDEKTAVNLLAAELKREKENLQRIAHEYTENLNKITLNSVKNKDSSGLISETKRLSKELYTIFWNKCSDASKDDFGKKYLKNNKNITLEKIIKDSDSFIDKKFNASTGDP